jgi:hypothetical protein
MDVLGSSQTSTIRHANAPQTISGDSVFTATAVTNADLDWVDLAQDRENFGGGVLWAQYRNFGFHKMWRKFLACFRSLEFSKKTLLRGESQLDFKALFKASLNNQTALHSLIHVHSSASNSIGLRKGVLPMSPACFNLKLPKCQI